MSSRGRIQIAKCYMHVTSLMSCSRASTTFHLRPYPDEDNFLLVWDQIGSNPCRHCFRKRNLVTQSAIDSMPACNTAYLGTVAHALCMLKGGSQDLVGCVCVSCPANVVSRARTKGDESKDRTAISSCFNAPY
jgi:hypothetical protein